MLFYSMRLKNASKRCKLAYRMNPGDRIGIRLPEPAIPPDSIAPHRFMSDNKRIRKPSALRRFFRVVLWTACLAVVLLLLAVLTAVLTADMWIVPAGAWYAGVEVEGTPGVSLSLSNRELLLTDLKLKTSVGTFEAKSCGLRFEGMTMTFFFVRGMVCSAAIMMFLLLGNT